MKPIIYSYILLLFYTISDSSCHARLVPQGSALNSEVKDDQGRTQLLGKCTRGRLEQAPYDSWFVRNYTSYVVDSAAGGQLKAKLGDKQLKIFMGTWCGDSQREVSRIFKILDYCGVDASRV